VIDLDLLFASDEVGAAAMPVDETICTAAMAPSLARSASFFG
jgi:hypothetical protein